MGPNDFILDGMRWSFSSVNTYNTCPQAFKLGYLDALPRQDNAFSDWGTFMHSIMERYFKGELEFYELSKVYVDGYGENVKCQFPPNRFCDLGQRYYDAGKTYLDNFEGLFEDYTVLGVEQRVQLDIDGRPFVGVIDLLLRSPDGIVIVDHKSKGRWASKNELHEYARQLYLYAIYVKQKYGVWPIKLIFHMIRDNGNLVQIDFSEDDADEAKQWFIDNIDKIYADVAFESTPNRIRRQMTELKTQFDMEQIGFYDYKKQKKKLESELNKQSFMCCVLCGVREKCPNKDKAPEENCV